MAGDVFLAPFRQLRPAHACPGRKFHTVRARPRPGAAPKIRGAAGDPRQRPRRPLNQPQMHAAQRRPAQSRARRRMSVACQGGCTLRPRSPSRTEVRGLQCPPRATPPFSPPPMPLPCAAPASFRPVWGGGEREARGCAAWRMPPAVRLGRRRRAIMPKLWREPGPAAGRTRLGGGGGDDGCLGAKACGNARPCAQGAVQSRLARRTPLPTLRRAPRLRPVPDRRRALFRGRPGPPPNARR